MTAIYCPATLDLMRKYAHQGLNAVAEMLGWPIERTASVARRHGIELLAKSEIRPPVVDAPPTVPETPLRQWATWSLVTGVITTPIGTLKLKQQRARVFDELWRAKGPLVGHDLAERTFVSGANVCAFIKPFSHELEQIGLAIEGRRGRGAGYLLVKVPS